MARARGLIAAGEPRPNVVDTLILNFEQRRVREGTLTGARGTRVDFEFADTITLRTDDAFLLDDGTAVEIVAEAENLIEVRAEHAALARIAWMLGDRHVPVQILPNRVRLRPDEALERMLSALGGRIARIEAPFEPEGGAYAAPPHGHAHDHDHHDHAHGHHHHGHDHHGHDHHGHDHAHHHGDHEHAHDDHGHQHDHDHGHGDRHDHPAGPDRSRTKR
jgi:urease accessory protein